MARSRGLGDVYKRQAVALAKGANALQRARDAAGKIKVVV
jgi:phosphoribosylglycinamide formyltransferase 2